MMTIGDPVVQAAPTGTSQQKGNFLFSANLLPCPVSQRVKASAAGSYHLDLCFSAVTAAFLVVRPCRGVAQAWLWDFLSM